MGQPFGRIACIGVAMLGALVSVAWTLGESSEMVGADKCKECHSSSQEVWLTSNHARAQGNLPTRFKQDPKCVQCHGSEKDSISGVQCESCHGQGTYYSKRYIMKDKILSRLVGLEDVSKKTCKRCHVETTPNIFPFDHAKMWQLIQHGSNSQSQQEITNPTS